MSDLRRAKRTIRTVFINGFHKKEAALKLSAASVSIARLKTVFMILYFNKTNDS